MLKVKRVPALAIHRVGLAVVAVEHDAQIHLPVRVTAHQDVEDVSLGGEEPHRAAVLAEQVADGLGRRIGGQQLGCVDNLLPVESDAQSLRLVPIRVRTVLAVPLRRLVREPSEALLVTGAALALK